MKAINFTPHPVHLITEDGIIEIPSSGTVRLTEKVLPLEKHIVLKSFNQPEWQVKEIKEVEIPPYFRPDYIIIVSFPVLQALKDKDVVDLPIDLPPTTTFVAPDTGPESVVRDKEGRIIGVKRFCVLA